MSDLTGGSSRLDPINEISLPPEGDDEICDDGNATSGDGCREDCRLEPGFTCVGEPSECMPDCGDGLQRGGEECDDQNNLEGDGCSSICTVGLAVRL